MATTTPDALADNRPPLAGRVWKVGRTLPLVPTVILGLLLLAALFAPLIAPHDPLRPVADAELYAPPIWADGGSWSTPLGTDFQGRDLFSRLVHGARVSVIVGLTGTLFAGGVGLLLGIVAGYFGGWVDMVIMRLTDAWLALPSLVFAILLAITLGPSMWNIVLVLGLIYWTRYARVIRGEVLSLREREFVRLAQVAGCSRWRIIRRHILPNVLNTWMVLATLTVGVVIIAEASLSFLGVGVPPPQPAWGVMLNDGRTPLFIGKWWLMAAPGLCIFAVVLATNLFGDWLRVRLDPQQRNL